MWINNNEMKPIAKVMILSLNKFMIKINICTMKM